MFIGLPVTSNKLQDAQIDLLRSYIHGLIDAHRLAKIDTSEIDEFFEWLIDEKDEFPTKGWDAKYFEDCGRNHLLAIQKFWGFLHEFVLLKSPEWFIRLNQEPIPSQLRNGAETPNSLDIRLLEHKEIAIKNL